MMRRYEEIIIFARPEAKRTEKDLQYCLHHNNFVSQSQIIGSKCCVSQKKALSLERRSMG
jgi:hypothetical protein